MQPSEEVFYKQYKKRIEELEADIKIKQSVCETIEKEVAEINEKLRERIEELEDELTRLRKLLNAKV